MTHSLLVTYSFTKSKSACNVLGTAIPGAKYATIYNFITDFNIGNEADCPDGDVIFMFDNEQVIGKSWNVTANNKVKMSCITNVAVVKVTNNKDIQKNENLKPGNWLTTNEHQNIISDMCETEPNTPSSSFINDIKQAHYKELYHVLDLAIEQVSEELNCDGNSNQWIDDIDKDIERLEFEKQFKKCPRCNYLLEKSKRKCPQCKETVADFNKASNKSNVNNTVVSQVSSHKPIMRQYGKEKPATQPDVKFNHVKSAHDQVPSEVILLDPVFVNPNSFESIVLILRHIGKKARISKYSPAGDDFPVRYWTFVCCDGLPHGMVRRIIEEYFVCMQCGEGILGIEATKNHDKSKHGGIGTRYSQEFDWVFLVCGDGHYEMNLMKSFMELNWNVFMKSFVEIMGFRSEKAQRTALCCSDNHKTWQIILIFHLGTILELVKPYVEKCLVEKSTKSAEGYISFVKSKNHNANYLYIFEMACRYSQAIINLRMAVRRNNNNLLQAGKWMSKELFHGRNHPLYQDIEIFDQYVQMILPDEVKDFFMKHSTLSKSGHPSKGQGYDFILEEENKLVKSWLKKGVPTEKVWLSTCRNHQSLKNIKNTVMNFAGLVPEDITFNHGNEKELKIDDAIYEWRLLIRQTKYLSDEKHGPVLTSISAVVLDQELSQFTTEANRKRSYRILDMLLHQPPPNDPTIHHPIYILQSEREKYSSIESLTITEIDHKILDIIDDLDEQSKQLFLALFRDMTKNKSTRKEDHVNFLEEVTVAASHLEFLDNETSFLDIIEAECEDLNWYVYIRY